MSQLSTRFHALVCVCVQLCVTTTVVSTCTRKRWYYRNTQFMLNIDDEDGTKYVILFFFFYMCTVQVSRYLWQFVQAYYTLFGENAPRADQNRLFFESPPTWHPVTGKPVSITRWHGEGGCEELERSLGGQIIKCFHMVFCTSAVIGTMSFLLTLTVQYVMLTILLS